MPVRDIIAGTWPNNYNMMQHPQMAHENLTFFKFEPIIAYACRNKPQQAKRLLRSKCCDMLR